jgi:hypothetical protein
VTGDDYIALTVQVETATPKAVLLRPVDAAGQAQPRAAWIPRSCIHGGDDIALDRLARGSITTLRVRAWKAEREGLA